MSFSDSSGTARSCASSIATRVSSSSTPEALSAAATRGTMPGSSATSVISSCTSPNNAAAARWGSAPMFISFTWARVRTSMLQSVRRLASLTFSPCLPIASEN